MVKKKDKDKIYLIEKKSFLICNRVRLIMCTCVNSFLPSARIANGIVVSDKIVIHMVARVSGFCFHVENFPVAKLYNHLANPPYSIILIRQLLLDIY